MGCWNGTCLISNLPIQAGDRVKLVLLHSPYGKSSMLGMSAFCYPHGVLTPAAWPLSGQYNDYGCVEGFDEDWNYRLVEVFFKEKYKEIEVKKIRKKDFTIPDLVEGIERGSLKILMEGNKEMKAMAEAAMKAYKDMPEALDEWRDMAEQDVSEKWRNSELSFVMIREDIWDGLCNSEFPTFFNPDDSKIGPNEWRVSAKAYCTYQFNKVREKLSKLTPDSDRFARLDFRYALEEARLFEGGEGFSLILRDFYKEALQTSTAYEGFIDDFFKAWFEFTAICSQMSLLRKSWMPQSGAGSQSQEWEAYLYLNQIVDKICRDAINLYNEDEEE